MRNSTSGSRGMSDYVRMVVAGLFTPDGGVEAFLMSDNHLLPAMGAIHDATHFF